MGVMSVAITTGYNGVNPVANQPTHFNAAVTNNTGSDVTLTSMSISTVPSGPNIGQPTWLTAGAAQGSGQPTVANGSTNNYGFEVVFPAPNTAGMSPNSAATTGSIVASGQPARSSYVVICECLTSDGSVFRGQLQIGPSSTIPPFPIPQGGAVNFIPQEAGYLTNAIVLGVL